MFTTKAFYVRTASLTTIITLYTVTLKVSDILEIVRILVLSKTTLRKLGLLRSETGEE
jgi:hypothetical protein